MPQAAQQDYLIIPIGSPEELTESEKREISEKIERGILFDCLIYAGNAYSKILSYDPTSKLVFYSDATNDGQIGSLDYEE